MPLHLVLMRAVCIVFVLLCLPLSSWAAAPPPALQQQVEQEQQRIQQEQQRILEQERLRREVEQAIKRPPAEEKAPEAPAKPDEGPCIEINSLDLGGNTVLLTQELDDAFARYRGQCLSIARINALLQDITNLYLNSGYITSRAFMSMPQNRLKEGVLEVRIVEGRVSEMQGIKRREYWTAFPWVEGEVLNLRDIEQGLEQMNRLPSNRATMDVKPSPDKEGQSDIVISNTPQGRIRLGGYGDNAGSENTGEWRAGARLAADNLLGLNEQFNFNYATAPSYNSDHRDSNSYSGNISLPFGYWTFTYSLSRSDYRSSFAMPISGERYYYYGNSLNHNFTTDRVLWRNQFSKASLAVGLTYKDSNNYSQVADIKIRNEASSRSLTVLSFELPVTFYLPSSVLYLKPGYQRGTRWLGALRDSDSPYEQQAQFNLVKFYGYHSIRWGGVSLSTALDIQSSRDELFSSEALYIGGEYSVRGFRDDSIQGDRGFTLRNDVSLDLNSLFGTQSELLAIFTPGVFVDYGYVDSNSAYAEHADLWGAGASLSVNWKFFQASATYAVVLHKEDWMRDNNAWYLHGGVNFRF